MNFSALPELRRRHLLQVAVAYTGASALPVIAQPTYPEKPVRIIHAYPGAPLDAAVRFMADKLSAAWKQPVLVDTRPGASELIAGDAVAKAPPDGYTLFVGAESNFTNNQFLYAKLPFDPERDLVPVTELYQLPFCLIVPGDFPANTLAEFVALLKRPGADYAYASTGPGSPNQLAMETMFQALGVRMRHVPYKVGPMLTQDLVAGRVSALIAGVFTAAPFVPSGRLKVLAVSGAQRQPALPKAPTFAEAGYPGIDLRTFCGMAAPRGTPAEIVSRIQQQVRASLFTPDYQEKVGAPFGYAPVGSTPAEFADALKRRRETMQQLIKKLGLRLE